MQDDDQNGKGGWVQVPTTMAFEAGFQSRMIRAALRGRDLWISAADVCAAVDLPSLSEWRDQLEPEMKWVTVLRTAGLECRLDMVDAWEVGHVVGATETALGDAFVRWLAKLLTTARQTGDFELFLRVDGAVRFSVGDFGRVVIEQVGGRVVVTRLVWEETAGPSRPSVNLTQPGQNRWLT